MNIKYTIYIGNEKSFKNYVFFFSLIVDVKLEL